MSVTRDDVLSAHWAAQVVSAAGTTLLPARDDFGHTNLGWSSEHAALVGRELPDGRAAALRLADLALLVVGPSPAELPLEGRTLDEATGWLAERLGAELARPAHDMPDPPARFGRGSPELSEWFAVARVEIFRTTEIEPRCWPHHFDIAALLRLDDGRGEDARSVGVGMTPGDASYDRPYWYVTPWPYPASTSELPALPSGGVWHTEGWVGAVLPGVRDPASVRPFLAASLAAASDLAGN